VASGASGLRKRPQAIDGREMKPTPGCSYLRNGASSSESAGGSGCWTCSGRPDRAHLRRRLRLGLPHVLGLGGRVGRNLRTTLRGNSVGVDSQRAGRLEIAPWPRA